MHQGQDGGGWDHIVIPPSLETSRYDTRPLLLCIRIQVTENGIATAGTQLLQKVLQLMLPGDRRLTVR